MRLQQLHLIVTLAQAGSLRAAATRLNVTQPALTKALRQLEEEFGTPLVLRTPKGVRLTPAGELVAARAATVVREIDKAHEEVAWQLRSAHARVGVGVSPAAAMVLMPGALQRVRARWPQVQVRLVDALFPSSLTLVRSGEIDLAVGPLPPQGAGRDLLSQALFDAHTVLAARRGHPLAGAQRLGELIDADWVLAGPAQGPGDPGQLDFGPDAGAAKITPAQPADGRAQSSDAHGEALGTPAARDALARPRVVLECESFATLLAVLPSVEAVALVPRSFFEQHGPRTGLVRVPVTDQLPHVTLHAAWRADTPLTPPASTLLDALMLEAAVHRRPQRTSDAGSAAP